MALEYREEYGLAGDDFDVRVRERFEAAVVQVYLKHLNNHLQKLRISRAAVGRALRTHRSTVSRWIKGTTDPSLRSFLFTWAAFDIDVGAVGFPVGREVVIQAMLEALAFIRNDELHAGPPAKLDREQFEYLYYLCLSGWRAAVAGEDHGGDGTTDLEKEAAAINRQVAKKVTVYRAKRVEELDQVLSTWLIPWALFDTVIPYDWPF